MTENTIQVKHLSKSFKDTEVLKGVDFEAKRGEIFALHGSNGAGKTTIVKILTTLHKQDSGTALINGLDVVAKADSVRQSVSLTGRENLIMITKLRHLQSAFIINSSASLYRN